MRLLRQHADGSGLLEDLLDAELSKGALAPADRGLVQELTFGVVRWRSTLDWLIARKTDERPQKPSLKILLRLALYQLFWLDRIPDHAAVHETVQLARDLGFESQSGFINAVLRNCLRERPALEQELENLKQRSLHLGYSHPEWLCNRWLERWGREKVCSLLDWNNTAPSVFVRVNALKSTPENLAQQFDREGVLFTPRDFDWAPGGIAFELRSHPPLASLPSFREGMFYVQDPSTLLAVRELNPQPGETILDLCAAPGGKATMIAQLMENRGTVIAHDVEPGRLKLISENCTRLGASCVKATSPAELEALVPATQFDRILVDAPCSNSGVIRRRVELRWRIQPSEIERLRDVQLQLVWQAAAMLKPGGTLVYSTCSLEPEENSEVVAEFLATVPGFTRVSERSLIPFNDATDGAFVATLRKE